jgi:hypothetical protein
MDFYDYVRPGSHDALVAFNLVHHKGRYLSVAHIYPPDDGLGSDRSVVL